MMDTMILVHSSLEIIPGIQDQSHEQEGEWHDI